jgi:hypothetical protein
MRCTYSQTTDHQANSKTLQSSALYGVLRTSIAVGITACPKRYVVLGGWAIDSVQGTGLEYLYPILELE